MNVTDEEIENHIKTLEETVKWILENCPVEQIKATTNPNTLYIKVKKESEKY